MTAFEPTDIRPYLDVIIFQSRQIRAVAAAHHDDALAGWAQGWINQAEQTLADLDARSEKPRLGSPDPDARP